MNFFKTQLHNCPFEPGFLFPAAGSCLCTLIVSAAAAIVFAAIFLVLNKI